MTYRCRGEGPPLFVVPGIASTYHIYALFLNQLAERFRTIIYDYPGENSGDGAKLKRITHEDLVDDLFGLIDHLNIGRAFLTGLSFGSTVVLRACIASPVRLPQGRRARRVRFSQFLDGGNVGAGIGSPGPRNRSSGFLSRAGLELQMSGLNFRRFSRTAGRSTFERNGETPIRSARASDQVAHDARPSADPAGDPDRDALDPGARRSHHSPPRLRSARVRAAKSTRNDRSDRRPYPSLDARRASSGGMIGDRLLPCAPEGCRRRGRKRPAFVRVRRVKVPAT